ncbi:hypothetical protein P4C99_19460 [Pontiellaceae bacterium B1224]|nr:hypothetical protein [Pontiellaceae bacterium B1224]
MILLKKAYSQSVSRVVLLTLFSTGITFCGVIWLIDIAAHILESGNYLISAPSPYFNYRVLCEFIFGGFCILALILILKKESTLLALALMVSCASIAINTVLLKKISSLSHREWISTLEQLIQDENTHIGTSIFYKQEHRQYVKLWNLVEVDKIEPNTMLYRVRIHLNDKDLLNWDRALDKIEGILWDHLYCCSVNDLEEHLNDGIYIKIDNVEDHHSTGTMYQKSCGCVVDKDFSMF